MRVLLLQAFTALDMELVYPIGLAWLAAHLDGHDVRLFDMNLHARSQPLERLADELRAFRPDVVGISLRNIKVARPGAHEDDFAPQQRTVEAVRAACPGARIIAGGTAFSLYAEEFMRRLPALDLGVWGEAEHRFGQLLADLAHPERVPGVWYRDQGQIRYTGAPPVVDFASLRPPRRDLLDLAPYKASSFVSVGVQSKRGCALRCVHCSDTYLAGHTVRRRDPRVVVDEIESLHREHGVEQLFFCDQIFNIPVQHAIDICDELAARRLPVRWSAWFNEHRNTLPDALMVALKRAGCGLLSFSPDHVDDRMLQRLDKNFRHKDLVHTYQIAKKHDMDVEYSFFLNSPGEDLRSMAAIFRFLADAKWALGPRLRMFTLLMMQPIRLYPHTRLAEMARDSGLIDRDHALIDGQFWNPGALRYAVSGVQAGAQAAWSVRNRIRRGRTPTVDR